MLPVPGLSAFPGSAISRENGSEGEPAARNLGAVPEYKAPLKPVALRLGRAREGSSKML